MAYVALFLQLLFKDLHGMNLLELNYRWADARYYSGIESCTQCLCNFCAKLKCNIKSAPSAIMCCSRWIIIIYAFFPSGSLQCSNPVGPAPYIAIKFPGAAIRPCTYNMLEALSLLHHQILLGREVLALL